MDKTSIEPELIKSYLSMHYHVCAARPFFLEIGKQSCMLSFWHKIFEVNCSAFITAYNRYDKYQTSHENKLRHKQLQTDMEKACLPVIDGYCQDEVGKNDKVEYSLIFGISLKESKEVGNKYTQNAIVYCEEDLIPQLILLR
jgi:hypothetical protein